VTQNRNIDDKYDVLEQGTVKLSVMVKFEFEFGEVLVWFVWIIERVVNSSSEMLLIWEMCFGNRNRIACKIDIVDLMKHVDF